MTDEEKKEYEEFLKWKKESLQREKKSVETDVQQERGTAEQTVTNASNDDKTINKMEEDTNYNRVLLIVGIFILFLIVCVIALSLQTRQTLSQQQQRKDSIAVVEKARKDSIANVQRIAKVKQDSIARIKRKEILKHSILIKSAYLSSPNSASGVSAYFYYVNKSSKVIKYLTWHGYPINAVGDMVSCDIRGNSNFNGQDTGPVKPGRSGGGCWDCAWYNWSAKKLILTGIDIIYMDGSTLSISEEELKYVR